MIHKHYALLLRTTWRYAAAYRSSIVLVYGLLAIANVVVMLEPIVLGRVLNIIQLQGNGALSAILLNLALYASLSVVYWVFHSTARILERTASFHIVKNFTEDMFGKIASLPLRWHKDNHSGATIDKLRKASNALRQFSSEGFTYIETIVHSVIAIAAIVYIVPFYGMLVVLFSGIIVVIIFRFDAVLVRSLDEINKREHLVAATLFDYIANMITVITLRLQTLAQNEVARRILDVLPEFRKNIKLNELKWFIVGMLLVATNFALLSLYIWQQIAAGEVILIGSLMALYQYIQRFIDVFYRLAWQYEKMVWEATDLKTIKGILASYEALDRPAKTQSIAADWQRIDIMHLDFTYEDKEHHTHQLRDVGLVLERGKRIALVGESGSGKSTLLVLLRGLEAPSRVAVTIDGVAHSSLEPLSPVTTLIPQDPEIFENSVEYNITAGISHTPEQIASAMALARFEGVVERLPAGMQTHINEKGVNLSGGEKQRLALSRGIFAAQDSSIILMDEPTSSVDSINEVAIYRNIFLQFADACIVSSIHRLHLLPKFDRIYVLEKGRVVEEGTFAELTQGKGKLAEMWAHYEQSMTKKDVSL